MGSTHSRTRSSRARRWANEWAAIFSASMGRRPTTVGLMLGIAALGVTLGATPALPQSTIDCPPFVCTSFVATFSTDPPPFTTTQPAGINSRGEIVGFMTQNWISHGFIRDVQGNFAPLDYLKPGAGFTFPVGINASGRVVLRAYTTGFTLIGSFLAQPPYSAFTPITVTVSGEDLGGTDGKPVPTAVVGINSRGEIVGTYVDIKHYSHAFLLDPGGNVTTIDLQDGCTGFASLLPVGINDPGQVLVLGRAGRDVHVLVYAQGTCTSIDQQFSAIPNFNNQTSFAGQAGPAGINNRGEVIGLYWGTDRMLHGFLLHRDGSVDPIDLRGIRLTGINERGEITGSFFDPYGSTVGLIVSGH